MFSPEMIFKAWKGLNIKTDQECWEWHGYRSITGYGIVCADKTMARVHRVIYSSINGEIPEGLVIDHICRNKSCSNPNHLRCVTRTLNSTENTESITAKNSRKTHCLRGHKLEGYSKVSGREKVRDCKECFKIRRTKLHERRKYCSECRKRKICTNQDSFWVCKPCLNLLDGTS